MGLKCRISYDKSGTVSVYDENGSPSRLFEDILTEVNNQGTALDLWALAQTEEFQESVDGFVTAQDVIKYADTDLSQHTKLTDAQKVSVRSILKTSGIRSLSELNERLLRTFKPNGVFEFNPRRAEESGLYTEEELRDLDQIALQEVMTVIEGQVQLYDIVVDEQNTEGSEYIDSSSRDILGRFQRVTEEKFNDDVNQLAELANDEAQLREAVMELPYTDFVNEFLENEQFRNEQIQRLRRLSVIPELHFDGDTLVNEDLSVYSTVRNTVDFDADTTEILADIQILEEMSPVGWDQQTEVKSALRSVAKDLIKYRVDLIGLEELSNEPDQVLNLLRAAEAMLDKPTKNNIQTFVALKQEYLPSAKPNRIETLPENYQGYNIVSVRTAKSDQVLFENGLIKVGNDLYHKVQLEDKSAIYDYVYDMYVRGDFNIPDHLKTVRSGVSDFNNKIEVLKDIEAFINSRDTGLKVNDQELLSLYQVAFEHDPINTVEPVNRIKKVSSVNTEAEYLKGEFINDFYEYYLEQKLENSDIYQDILSKFEFNSKGITLVGEVASLDNMEYSEEIKDYLRLRKDFDSELLLSDTAGNMTNAELLALNFPESVREYSGEAITEGIYAVVPHTISDFYRIDGKLYRRMLSRSDASLFMEVELEDNTIFYEADPDFPFDVDQAQEVFESLQVSPEQTTQEQVDETFKQARFHNKISVREGKSLNQLRSGEYTLEDSDTLYKGLDGKEDLGGQRINAHQGVNGIFAATDIKLAEEYGTISNINVPAGTTVEVIEVSPKGKTPDAYRQAEVEAINNSNAQIVKLRTMDGIMRRGERLQEQYIIKDENLINAVLQQTDDIGTTSEDIAGSLLEIAELKDTIGEFIQSKDYGDRVKFHGSPDIRYLRSVSDFDTTVVTRNAESKYLFLAQKSGTAVSYSTDQTRIGPNSGVAAIRVREGRQYSITKKDVKDKKSISEWELFYDNKKEEGYDILINTLDGNNLIVLNNDILSIEEIYNNHDVINNRFVGTHTPSTSQLQELSQNSVDILSSEIKVLDLYDTSEESAIKDEFDNCG